MTTEEEDPSAALTAKLLEGPVKDEEEPTIRPAEPGDLEQQPPPEWEVGEKQAAKCRDAFWAALFVTHILVVVVLAFVWGIPALNYVPSNGGEDVVLHFSGVLYLCLLAGLSSVVISGLTLGAMIHYAEVLVQISVLFSIVTSLILVVVLAASGETGAAIMAMMFFLLGCCYAWRVWNRIPFAAVNLSTAVTAVRANLGVALVSYGMVLVVFAWTTLWMLSLGGVYVRFLHCEDGVCHSHVSGWVILLYLLSYYWTQQVIKNVIHVTVAGVVGTWWIVPTEASSCCSPAIVDSFVRSVTYSFGSICFGSLLVAVIQVLHHLVIQARREGEDNVFLCILECIISLLESIMIYFNKWAYVYLGLYGYDYLESGKRAMNLFRARGWTTVINDDLVSNTLGLTSVVIAALSGVAGIVIMKLEPSWLSLFHDSATGVSFASAFLIGIMISSTLMSVVASGVDTVVVCFAETPAEFRNNYPELSEKMIRAWATAYPGEYTI